MSNSAILGFKVGGTHININIKYFIILLEVFQWGG